MPDSPDPALPPAEQTPVTQGAEGGNTIQLASPRAPVALRPALEEGTGPVVEPASDSARVAPVEHGRYRIYGEIARGGMGAILRARDQDLGRELAMKVLLEGHRDKPDVIERFVEEAQIGGQLQHPGIVPVYELGRFADLRPFFTMKLVKGKSLAALLRERTSPGVDRPRFLRIFLQVCETIAYAHSRGVIHRDVKPSNVMVGAFGEVQVMDWGLAKVLPTGGAAVAPLARPTPEAATVIRTVRTPGMSPSGSGSETHSGSVLGTPAYMPPEQAAGEVDRLDERCDVFGLGAVLCEILTGRPPYEGSDPSVVHRKAMLGDLREAHERLDSCGADVDLIQLAKRCLNADPDCRPRSATLLAKELADHFSASETKLHEAELASARASAKASEERKRRRVSLVLALTVVAAWTAGGWLWVSMARQRGARELELAEQRLRLSQQVNEALVEAGQRREQARASALDPLPLAQAREAVRRAESLLAAAPSETALAERVRAAANDVERDYLQRNLIDRLEAARMTGLEDYDPVTAGGDSFRAYRQAFAGVGIEPTLLTPEAAAARVREFPSPARELLTAALYQWSQLASPGLGVRVELREGRLRVQGVVPESPAHEDARLQAGDEIVGAARGSASEFTRVGDLPLDEFLPRLDGEPGLTIRLLVKRQGRDEEEVVELVRGKTFLWLTKAAEAAVADLDLARLRELVVEGKPEPLVEALRQFNVRAQSSPAVLDVVQELVSAAPVPAPELLAFCRRCQVAYPGDYLLNVRLSNLLAASDRADALRYAQAALAARPGSASAHAWVGLLLEEGGRLPEADACFRRALELAPGVVGYQYRAALAADALGRSQEAVELLRAAAKTMPGTSRIHAELGRVLGKLGQTQEAIAELRQAVQRSFNDSTAYVNLGTLLARSGETEEAAEMFRRAFEGNSADAAAYYNLGALLHRLGQREGAQAAFLKGLQLEPGFASSAAAIEGDRRYLPSLLDEELRVMVLALGDQAQAAAELERQARARQARGQPREAIAKLREAIQANPASAPLRQALGEALSLMGDSAGAIEQLAAAVRLDPSDLWQHLRLVQYCAWSGSLAEYRAHRAAMLKQFGDSADPIVLDRVAKSSLLLPDDHEDLRTAARLAARSVELADPRHWGLAYLYTCRALGEWRLGQHAAAEASAKSALSLQFENWRMDIPANLLLAISEHRLGKTAAARGHFAKAVTLHCSGPATDRLNGDSLICELLLGQAAQELFREPDRTVNEPLELVALALAARIEGRLPETAGLLARALAQLDPEAEVYPHIAFLSTEAAGLAAQEWEGARSDATRFTLLVEQAQSGLRAFLDSRRRAQVTNRAGDGPASERGGLAGFRNSAAAAVFRDEAELARQSVEQRAASEQLWRDLETYLNQLPE